MWQIDFTVRNVTWDKEESTHEKHISPKYSCIEHSSKIWIVKLTGLKIKIDKPTIIDGGFNTPVSGINETSRPKVSKDKKTWTRSTNLT